jgi:hypothetical protein
MSPSSRAMPPLPHHRGSRLCRLEHISALLSLDARNVRAHSLPQFSDCVCTLPATRTRLPQSPMSSVSRPLNFVPECKVRVCTFPATLAWGPPLWSGTRIRSCYGLVCSCVCSGSCVTTSAVVSDCAQAYNDFYRFNPAEGTWTMLPPNGSVPSPRCFSGFAATPDGMLYVFGGDAGGNRGGAMLVDVETVWAMLLDEEAHGRYCAILFR